MDILRNKRYASFDYISRYASTPYYYNSVDQKDMYGLGHNILKNVDWVAHKVLPTDTLDSLALKYYNNPSYWWIIANFNDIQDAFIKLSDHFSTLKIPPMSGYVFGDSR